MKFIASVCSSTFYMWKTVIGSTFSSVHSLASCCVAFIANKGCILCRAWGKSPKGDSQESYSLSHLLSEACTRNCSAGITSVKLRRLQEESGNWRKRTTTRWLNSNVEFQPCEPPIWSQFFVSNCCIYCTHQLACYLLTTYIEIGTVHLHRGLMQMHMRYSCPLSAPSHRSQGAGSRCSQYCSPPMTVYMTIVDK